MRAKIAVAVGACLFALGALAGAQQPPDGGKKDSGNVDTFVERMMEFNKKKDGKLTKEELTDPRLQRLFDRADTDKSGTLTRDELVAFYEKEVAAGGAGGGKGGPPEGGKGGKGDKGKGKGDKTDKGDGDKKGPPDGGDDKKGPPDGGKGGKGKGDKKGPPDSGKSGKVSLLRMVPAGALSELDISAEQRQQLETIHKDAEDRMMKVLTADQRKMLAEMDMPMPGGRDKGPRPEKLGD